MLFIGLHAYAEYNGNYRYILSVIDVFSKYLHMIPLKTKSGPFVASASRSIFNDPKYSTRCPIWVRTDKGKEFINKHIQNMLRMMASRFRCLGNPTWNVRSSNACVARFAIDSINISHGKIPIYMSMTCRNLSRPTMTRVTGRQRAWQMDEKGVSSRARSCRKSEFSCGATRAHQQREDAVCQSWRKEFQQRDLRVAKVIDSRLRAVYVLGI